MDNLQKTNYKNRLQGTINKRTNYKGQITRDRLQGQFTKGKLQGTINKRQITRDNLQGTIYKGQFSDMIARFWHLKKSVHKKWHGCRLCRFIPNHCSGS